MLVALVVDAHGDNHGAQSGHGPDQLLREKGVRRTEALASHHRRCGKDHYQSDKNQQHGDSKQPAVDTHALRHGTSFHHVDAVARLRKLVIVEFRMLIDLVRGRSFTTETWKHGKKPLFLPGGSVSPW